MSEVVSKHGRKVDKVFFFHNCTLIVRSFVSDKGECDVLISGWSLDGTVKDYPSRLADAQSPKHVDGKKNLVLRIQWLVAE